MKNARFFLVFKSCAALLFMAGCNLFGEKNACDSVVCPGNDKIFIAYKSMADSSKNLIGPGQFLLEDLQISPILLDKNGPSPVISKAILPPPDNAEISIMVNENLRGVALQLANFAPDTLFITTGIAQIETCCTQPAVTVSQLLANGLLIPSVSSTIFVDFYK